MNQNTVKAAFDALLRDTGITIQKSSGEVAAYLAERSAHLTANAGQPGIGEAIGAEARNSLQVLGVSAARTGDAADEATHARIFGLIFGVIAAGI